MEDQHLTQQNFAQRIDISAATLCNIFNGKTNPSLGIVDGIHRSFPHVNVYWLLYGTPPMYDNEPAEGDPTGAMAASGDPSVAQGVAAAVGSEGSGGAGLSALAGTLPGTAGAGSQTSGGGQGGSLGGKMMEPSLDFGAEGKQPQRRGGKYAASPSLFDQQSTVGVNATPKNMTHTEIKYIDKPQRKITEIRIFYDDQTWETFVPKK